MQRVILKSDSVMSTAKEFEPYSFDLANYEDDLVNQ